MGKFEKKHSDGETIIIIRMKIKNIYLTIAWLFIPISSFCQGSPAWNNPLNIAWSSDGITFNTPTVFQDSSGVPSVIKWKGDTLVAVFQWFRQPNPSPTWDRVAVKFSYDNGLTWTQPTPVIVNGLPVNYQRPFDPTLTGLNFDSLRLYFSSSNGFPMGGLDSTVNTYSAKSSDGINFYFESGARVDQPTNRVIDPAIIFFNTGWHFLSPIGAPQQGAYHYVSPDGLNFTPVSNIPSDNFHNWTGNYMIENNNELRFYGSGRNIWYNYSPNGGIWSGYVNTNIQGGDPTVVKISSNNYLIVYVGQPYSTHIMETGSCIQPIDIFPNPAQSFINVKANCNLFGSIYSVYEHTGKSVLKGNFSENTTIQLGNLAAGIYLLSIGESSRQMFKVIKE